MTIITIDNIALAETLEPFFKVILPIIFGFIIYMSLKLICEIYDDKRERAQLKEVTQLYTARKRKFEGDEKGWKKWRDDNYKITDLIEADSYYG